MTVWAKQSQVLECVVAPVPVDMIKLDRDVAGDRMTFSPSALLAPLTA